jgi:aryl carrier-like protein
MKIMAVQPRKMGLGAFKRVDQEGRVEEEEEEEEEDMLVVVGLLLLKMMMMKEKLVRAGRKIQLPFLASSMLMLMLIDSKKPARVHAGQRSGAECDVR